MSLQKTIRDDFLRHQLITLVSYKKCLLSSSVRVISIGFITTKSISQKFELLIFMYVYYSKVSVIGQYRFSGHYRLRTVHNSSVDGLTLGWMGASKSLCNPPSRPPHFYHIGYAKINLLPFLTVRMPFLVNFDGITHERQSVRMFLTKN